MKGTAVDPLIEIVAGKAQYVNITLPFAPLPPLAVVLSSAPPPPPPGVFPAKPSPLNKFPAPLPPFPPPVGAIPPSPVPPDPV